MIRADDLYFGRGDRWLVDGVSLEIEPGTVTALLGPNGAGKTTLLRLLSGELSPDQGEIELDGRPLTEYGYAELAQMRGVMKQSSDVVFDFSVDEILAMGWISEHRYTRAQFQTALEWAVAVCDIDGLRDRTFNTLSGGEQQRVQFARTLLQIWRPADEQESRYLLLDEPTSSLDLSHELVVLKLAREMAGLGIGVLVILHDLNLASRFADQVCLLRRGRVSALGAPADVFSDELLSSVYETKITIEHHERLNRLVVHTL